LNINNTHDTLVKVKIRNNTENTGFFEKITNIDDSIQRLEKSKNKVEQYDIIYDLIIF